MIKGALKGDDTACFKNCTGSEKETKTPSE